MQEKNVNAKCPHCGADIYLGYNQGSGICPTCRKEFDNKKAIALYNALNNTQQKEEKKKASYGEEYLEVERILKRVDFYINRKEFRKAREEAESGLTISNTDYRLYFEIVRAETKNLTDYRNQSHKQFLDKAIEVADAEEKKIIMRLYKNFYQLSMLTNEEIEQYKKEENVAVKKKLEEKLKTLIPIYMKKERSIKTDFIIAFALIVPIIALPFFNSILILASSILFAVSFLLIKNAISIKKSIKLFNAMLDVYDALNSFELNTECLSNTLSQMKDLRMRFEKVGNLYEQEEGLNTFCNYLITTTEKARIFITQHPVLNLFIVENEE